MGKLPVLVGGTTTWYAWFLLFTSGRIDRAWMASLLKNLLFDRQTSSRMKTMSGSGAKVVVSEQQHQVLTKSLPRNVRLPGWSRGLGLFCWRSTECQIRRSRRSFRWDENRSGYGEDAGSIPSMRLCLSNAVSPAHNSFEPLKTCSAMRLAPDVAESLPANRWLRF